MLEGKGRIIFHIGNNTDPTGAGAEVGRVLKEEELEEAAPVKVVI